MATNLCLTCDSVFDILTRGPYPDGESIVEVDQHLAACHECRQMAEALRPATTLFHEAMSLEEKATLPAFQLELPEWKSEASAVTSTNANQVPPTASTSRWSPTRILTACVCCVLFGGLVGFAVQSGMQKRSLANDVHVGTDLPYQFGTVDFTLTPLQIPEACERNVIFAAHPTETRVKATDKGEFDCCTRCHVSTGTDTAKQSTAVIAGACLTCHEPNQRQNDGGLLNKTGLWSPNFNSNELETTSIRRWLRFDTGGLTDTIQTVTTQFELFAQTA